MNRANKVRLCGEWLLACEAIGWSRESFPALEEIFWTYEGWRTFAGYIRPPRSTFKFSR